MHDKIFDLFWVNYNLYFYAQLIFRIYGLDNLNIVIYLVMFQVGYYKAQHKFPAQAASDFR